MAAISQSFDFQILVVQPELTRGLSQGSKNKLNTTGEFIFTPPEQIIPTLAEQASTVKPVEEDTEVQDALDNLQSEKEQINRFISIIDNRCKHIVVNYNPNLKSDEGITDACEKVFNQADGRITYTMYAQAVDYLQQLDLFMGHRTIQNEGSLDGA